MEQVAVVAKIQIAPMMGWTDQHFRYLMRLLSPDVLNYSEMVTTGALLYGDRARYLQRHDAEGAVILQLGGSCPDALARCAVFGQEYGYAGINLNVGCPSTRVQAGKIGACLYKDPVLVASCVEAMVQAVDIPISVKCRIGVDDVDGLAHLVDFLQKMHEKSCHSVQLHARKAWLKGLNPKQNRSIPPLEYDFAYQASQKVLGLPIILNGGLNDRASMEKQLGRFPGVMLGRVAYMHPLMVRAIAMQVYPSSDYKSLDNMLSDYLNYVVDAHECGHRLSVLTKPLFNLCRGQAYAKKWKKSLMAFSGKRQDVHKLIDIWRQMTIKIPV
ncbi:MAG: tRNA dihydrouridine(20/20a) synthase DusA [Pseudomonadota bacterium]|nr:tRNA dihydrouridine(20/20a) synthase DusA [Pseudomonadota bacterium]